MNLRRRAVLGGHDVPLLRDTLRAGRPSAVRRRWTAALPGVLQCAGTATLAWAVATVLLRHTRPVFAASAAIVCLASGAGGRARRAVDLFAGVFVGVLVGLVVTALRLHDSAPAAGLAVLLAMLVVAVLDTRPLALIQAGTSALFMLTLPPTRIPAGRLADAAIGGALGLLGSQVLFTPDPVRLVAGAGRRVLADVAEALRAASARDAGRGVACARVAAAGLGDLHASRRAARNVATRTLRGRRQAARLAHLERRLDHLPQLAAAVFLLATDPPPAASGRPEQLRLLAATATTVAAAWPAPVPVPALPDAEGDPLLRMATTALAGLCGGRPQLG